MPDYCHSCHYNKFCKDHYISSPTCPMGYSPIKLETKPSMGVSTGSEEYSSLVYQPKILLNIAKWAMNRNDYQTSINCYEKILELQPTDREAAFLLKRARFMMGDTEAFKKKYFDTTQSTSKAEPKETKSYILPQQQKITKLQIKPRQQFRVDPNIIGKKPEKVYGVEVDEEEELKEEVSKHVAIRSKGSVLKKKGTMIAFGLSLAIIIMIVIGLYLFGFLQI